MSGDSGMGVGGVGFAFVLPLTVRNGHLLLLWIMGKQD